MAARKTKAKSNSKPKSQSKALPRADNAPQRAGSNDRTISKSAFVRSLPPTLSAKEVSEKAKSVGLDISERYVHVIRSNARA